MTELEARRVFSNIVAIAEVLGGDIPQMCAERGIPSDLAGRLIKEKERWDRGLARFNWDGSLRDDR